MLTEKESAYQRKLEARLQAEINAKKSKNVILAGNLQSQWGKVVTNEQRLIDNGHFMMTGDQAKLSYLKESYKKTKKAVKNETKIVLIKKI